VRIPVSVEERIAIARKLGNSKISMHQDVERRRPLEIDAIVGSVMELGRKAGIATPMTGAIHALVTERARHLDG
jgi:2-dehydropantoate 2-reductase